MTKTLSLSKVAALIIVLFLIMSCTANADSGKLYIVGMGTAPDLITIRGAETIKKADIVLVHDPEGLEDWKDFIGNKEAWVFPRYCFLFMGIDPNTLKDPNEKKLAQEHASARQAIVNKIRHAVEQGKTVAILDGGDPMMYGETFYLEMLPKDFPSEIIPGVGSFQAASAAVKMSPPYGWDTSSVILTMSDWPGRTDTNEKLMEPAASMVFYTMHMDFSKLFAELKRHYPENTPVALVCYAGDRQRQKVMISTVGKFLTEVNLKEIPLDKNILLVGKFLTVGQARKDGLAGGRKFIEMMRYQNRKALENK
jgi:precorrin-4/cobalt-precorrin-4 C11-methyltransferase